jgi:hypothetical protein
MLKNWSRIALASFLVLMVGASVAFATTARVRSLGNTGDYISDDSAVNRWYSTLGSFANQVNAELGQYAGSPGSLVDTRGLGWTHACGDDGKWGTYRISLNENALDHPGFWIGNPFYQDHAPNDNGDLGDPTGGAYDDTPINKWDLAGAWDLGESASLGVSITQSKWSFEDTANDRDASNSWITLGAGFSWTNADNLVLDAALNFGNAGGTMADGAATTEWDSKTAFDVLGRLFWDWQDNVTVVPVVEYTSSEYSLSVSPTPLLPPNGQKLTDFLFGLGLNMDVNEDNMLVFALEFMRRKYEYANADTVAAGFASTTWNYTPTVRLALESDITTWFTTRIAAVKYLGNVTDETNGGDKFKVTPGAPGVLIGVTPPSGFDWFLGCGFTIAEWTIDLEINEETPFNVGYWLTGYSNYGAGGPVGRISAVYNY